MTCHQEKFSWKWTLAQKHQIEGAKAAGGDLSGWPESECGDMLVQFWRMKQTYYEYYIQMETKINFA